ncbi:MAG: hypothetical protein HY760_04230 [Nitrospirae bacterium]|nr:hypothetical protein [Nitrospirota bacterium]
MKVTLGLLAEYANVTSDGKLNILGIFDGIDAHNFPVVHRHLVLIMRVEAERVEIESPKKIEVRLIDEDGASLLSISGEIKFIEPPPGVMILSANNLLNFNDLGFAKAGNYEFKILVNGEVKGSVPLKVRQALTT